jgi:predicted outer membrane repeat protein
MVSLAFPAGSTHAAIITADGIACSLVDAITAANQNEVVGGCAAGDDPSGGGDVIELTGDVVLTELNHVDPDGCGNGLPAIVSTITIHGNDHSVTRSGNALFRLFDATNGKLWLERTTVRGGYTDLPGPCEGGGIKGTVTLEDSTVSGNSADVGGGIAGTVTLIRSTVSDNYADDGGGVYGQGTLTNSRITGNQTGGAGGGIYAVGPMSLSGTTVSGNKAEYFGGGIYSPTAQILLDHSQVTENYLPVQAYRPPGPRENCDILSGTSLGGGIYGNALLIDSTVSNNLICSRNGGGGGGGIYGTVTLINSTVSGNSVRVWSGWGGGGINGTATLINSTVSSNSLDVHPGIREGVLGVGVHGSGALIHSTITDHALQSVSSMAGISGSFTITNSVVARSADIGGEGSFDCYLATLSGPNLIEDGTCGAALSGDPLLGPLADNGGPTQTHALLPGSPAIDRVDFVAGQGCGSTDVNLDQRGVGRPFPSDGQCDLGAVEYSPFASFEDFNVKVLAVHRRSAASSLLATFRLGQESSGVDPPDEQVTLTIGTQTLTIPPGSFKRRGRGLFRFHGLVQDTRADISILASRVARQFFFEMSARGLASGAFVNPVPVTLVIGDDGGSTTANVRFQGSGRRH